MSPFSPGVGATSSLSGFAGVGGTGQGGGPGYAYTGQRPASVGYGAGGAGGVDTGSQTTPTAGLSPPMIATTPHPLGNQWGGGGGGGGGYFGGGGGASSGCESAGGWLSAWHCETYH